MLILMAGRRPLPRRAVLSVLDDLPQILRLWLVGAGLLLGDLRALDRTTCSWCCRRRLAGVVLRASVYVRGRALRRSQGLVAHATVVVGAGAPVNGGRALRAGTRIGLAPIGFVDSPSLDSATSLPAPCSASRSELAAVLQQYGRTRCAHRGQGEMAETDLVTWSATASGTGVRSSSSRGCTRSPTWPTTWTSVGDLPLVRLAPFGVPQLRLATQASGGRGVLRLAIVVLFAAAGC